MQNLHVPVSRVLPKENGKAGMEMDVERTLPFVGFAVIYKAMWCLANFTETLPKQQLLTPR